MLLLIKITIWWTYSISGTRTLNNLLS